MISIIVLSSDGYKDCWDPFFKLMKRNFPGIDQYEVLLSTNTLDYELSGLEIKVLKNGKDTSWSERLIMSLDQAENEIAMVMVEDFFMLSPVNAEHWKEYCNLIQRKDVDHIRLLYNEAKLSPIETDNYFIDRIPPYGNHRFLFLPGLWKKNILKKYLVSYETPHMAEIMGNYRSWIRKDHFFCVSKKYLKDHGRFYPCATSGAIIKGKWEKWLPERMMDNELELDYSIRGFKTSETQKSANSGIRMRAIQNPVSTMRSIGDTLKCFIN